MLWRSQYIGVVFFLFTYYLKQSVIISPYMHPLWCWVWKISWWESGEGLQACCFLRLLHFTELFWHRECGLRFDSHVYLVCRTFHLRVCLNSSPPEMTNRRLAITWTNVNPVHCCYISLTRGGKLKSVFFIIHIQIYTEKCFYIASSSNENTF